MTSDPQFKIEHSKFKICYLGAFDEAYPRNQVIRAGLEAHGYHVTLAKLPKALGTAGKLPLLWRAMRQEARDCDVIILAEFNQLLAPFAILLGRLLGKPVLVDYLVGLYDANILEREETRLQSWRARTFRWLDRYTIGAARGVFTDTAAHREAFRLQAGKRAERVEVVPVGAYDPWWSPSVAAPPKAPGEPLLVQFFGNYIPFHGLPVMIRAFSWLNTDERFRFQMIGRGQTYDDALERAKLLGIRHIEFLDPVPPEDLPALVAQADICLGVFGRRTKTDYVVPNKVYQCMALGKPVVTAEATAIDEHFTAGEHLVTVPPSNPGELAQALRALADDPARRARIGQAAAARIREAYLPEDVVRPLVAMIAGVVG